MAYGQLEKVKGFLGGFYVATRLEYKVRVSTSENANQTLSEIKSSLSELLYEIVMTDINDAEKISITDEEREYYLKLIRQKYEKDRNCK